MGDHNSPKKGSVSVQALIRAVFEMAASAGMR